MLDIRTFRSTKRVRVDLYRRYKHADPATKKAKFSYKLLGSFPLQEGYSNDLLELLQPEEAIQLKNWLADVRFAERFGVEADELEKLTIQVPKKFYDALTRLSVECKRVGIDFIPDEVMLQSLFKKAKSIQQKIDKINGFNSGILDNLTADDQEEKQMDTESFTLFKALLDLPQSIGKTCTELEITAKKLGKEKRIPPPQLKEWAHEMPGRNPNKRIKKWAYAIAIDVLQQHDINPLNIVKPDKVAEYWAFSKQESLSLQEAQKQFLKSFSVSKDTRQVVVDAITAVYEK